VLASLVCLGEPFNDVEVRETFSFLPRPSFTIWRHPIAGASRRVPEAVHRAFRGHRFETETTPSGLRLIINRRRKAASSLGSLRRRPPGASGAERQWRWSAGSAGHSETRRRALAKAAELVLGPSTSRAALQNDQYVDLSSKCPEERRRESRRSVHRERAPHRGALRDVMRLKASGAFSGRHGTTASTPRSG
jgi:hypothetical protein